MKPVTVSVVVSQPVEEVYDFLDVLANHEAFLDHFLVDWEFSGPARGVGARAEARASAPMSQDWTEFEVVEAARAESLIPPLTRAFVKRPNAKAMRRLAKLLERAEPGA